MTVAICLLATQAGSGKALTASPQNQDEMVRTSRQAVVDTGFSPDYFDKHFKLIQVVNKPGDIRVVWQFTHGEYQIQVTDSFGFYTAGGKRIYVHSIANNLGRTRNLGETISKRRALAKMTSCLGGRFASDSVVLMRLHQDRQAGLYLMAYAAKGRTKEDSDRERYEKQQSRPADAQDRPPVEGDRDRPVTIGYINLETGKCSKGEASSTP